MTGLDATLAAVRAVASDRRDVVRARELMLGFATAHPDALLRSCLPGHFTGSALVVDAPGERVLLLLHAKLGRWLQPGGHADGDGDLARVALREAEEETGLAGLEVRDPALDLDVHEIPVRGDEPGHLHLDVRYLVHAPDGARLDPNHESLDIGWFRRHETAGLDLDPGLERLIELAVAAGALAP